MEAATIYRTGTKATLGKRMPSVQYTTTLNMEDPLLTDQQIENGIDWTPRSQSARAMTPHAVRAFYEAQITKDRALIQALLNALDSTEALDNGCPLPTWQKGYDKMCEERSSAISMAKEQGFKPTEE